MFKCFSLAYIFTPVCPRVNYHFSGKEARHDRQRFLRLLLYIALFCVLTVLFFRFLLPVLLPFLIGLLLALPGGTAVRLLRQRWRAPRDWPPAWSWPPSSC